MIKVIFTETSIKDFIEASLSLSFYAVGSLMPVWLTYILLTLFNRPIGINTFLDNGDFAIYAAAALSPLIFLLYRQPSALERALYLLLVIAALIFAAVIFSGLTAKNTLTIIDVEINIGFLRFASFIIYAFALLATFVVDLHEIVYNKVNPLRERAERQDVLAGQFDSEMGFDEDRLNQ